MQNVNQTDEGPLPKKNLLEKDQEAIEVAPWLNFSKLYEKSYMHREQVKFVYFCCK